MKSVRIYSHLCLCDGINGWYGAGNMGEPPKNKPGIMWDWLARMLKFEFQLKSGAFHADHMGLSENGVWPQHFNSIGTVMINQKCRGIFKPFQTHIIHMPCFYQLFVKKMGGGSVRPHILGSEMAKSLV